MRIERVFHNYHFEDNENTGYLYHSGSLIIKDSSFMKYTIDDFTIQGQDTIYQEVFVKRVNIESSTDQDIIDNIYMALELDKVDRETDYNWNQYFDNYELLKNRTLHGYSSLDSTRNLEIEIGEISPIVKFDSTNFLLNELRYTIGMSYFQDKRVSMKVTFQEMMDLHSKYLPGYIKGLYQR